MTPKERPSGESIFLRMPEGGEAMPERPQAEFVNPRTATILRELGYLAPKGWMGTWSAGPVYSTHLEQIPPEDREAVRNLLG